MSEVGILKISTIINMFFAAAGFVFAILARSQSVLFDALYSFTSSFFTLISARIVHLVMKGDDRKYQFGYGAFEPLFIVIRSIFTICMNLVLGANALRAILTGGYTINITAAGAYTLLSIVSCLIFFISLKRAALRFDSPVLRAESKSWLNDTLISLSVLAAFIIMAVLSQTGFAFVIPYIDPAIAIIFICCMLPQFLKQLFDNMRELLTAAPPAEVQKELDAIIEPFISTYDFDDFRTYSAQRGRTLYTVVHIYMRREESMLELDRIRKLMVQEIRAYRRHSDIDIVFTLNPAWIDTP